MRSIVNEVMLWLCTDDGGKTVSHFHDFHVIYHVFNGRIDRALEMTSDALIIAGKHVTSNSASARSKQYTTVSVSCSNECIDNRFVGSYVMAFGPTKARKSWNVEMHNVICANQKTETLVYRWLCAHAMFNVMLFTALAGALNVIASVVSID